MRLVMGMEVGGVTAPAMLCTIEQCSYVRSQQQACWTCTDRCCPAERTSTSMAYHLSESRLKEHGACQCVHEHAASLKKACM